MNKKRYVKICFGGISVFGIHNIYYVEGESTFEWMNNENEFKRLMNVMESLNTLLNFKINELEFKEDNFILYEMLTIGKCKDNLPAAIKLSSHYKRNNVKINRFII